MKRASIVRKSMEEVEKMNKKKWGVLSGIGSVGLALFMNMWNPVPVQASEEQEHDGIIYDGIYLNDISVGGMTYEEAKGAFEDYIQELDAVSVEFQLEDESYTMTLEELNLQADVDTAVEEAYSYGRVGNILKRYKEITDVSRENERIEVPFSFDETYLTEQLDTQLSDYITPAQNATMKYENEKLVVIEGTAGKELNLEETADKLLEAINNRKNDDTIQIAVVTDVVEPEHTAKELACVTDEIGSFSTRYTAGDPSRNNNIMNAAGKINGHVLYPGDEFDTMSYLLPFTTANGWSYAGAYLNGEVISDIGGGICQVSTTLYNAVLDAELEVTERYPHSMAVGYVQISADAALNEGTKNFRFVNNLDTPVFIYAYASGGTLHVSIYGKEYRPANRTVEYKNEIISVIQPGDPIETVDEAQPADYRNVTQSAHIGYKAKLWKYVYENGTLVDTILVNTSSYSASPERVTIGNPDNASESSEESPEEPAPTPEPTDPAPTDTTVPEPTATDTTATDTPSSENASTEPAASGQ